MPFRRWNAFGTVRLACPPTRLFARCIGNLIEPTLPRKQRSPESQSGNFSSLARGRSRSATSPEFPCDCLSGSVELPQQPREDSQPAKEEEFIGKMFQPVRQLEVSFDSCRIRIEVVEATRHTESLVR